MASHANQPLPAPVKALRPSLRACTVDGLRDRYLKTLAWLERLYGLRSQTAQDDDITGDMKRRRFADKPHNLWQASKT